MPLKTYPFDAARYIDEEGEMEILAEAAASGDAGYLFLALDVVARSRGMTEIARQAGISRKDLFDAALAEDDVDVGRLVEVFRTLTAPSKAAIASAAE